MSVDEPKYKKGKGATVPAPQGKDHLERWLYLEDDGKMGTLVRPSFFDKASADDSDLFCPYDSDKSNPGKCGSWCALLALGRDEWGEPTVTLCNGRTLSVTILDIGSPPGKVYMSKRDKRRFESWLKREE